MVDKVTCRKPRQTAALALCLSIALLLWLLSRFLVQATGQNAKTMLQAPLQQPRITRAIHDFLVAPLPPRNINISTDAPLIFLHQRKSAGTSFRAALVKAAAAANLKPFVPCHGGVHCSVHTMEFVNGIDIYAGHFAWGEQRYLTRHAGFDNITDSWRHRHKNASCLTVFRNPAERLMSCYYFYFVQKNILRGDRYSCLSNLAPQELKTMFIDGKSESGFGCLGEPFRILSGLEDEQDIASLSAGRLDSPEAEMAVELTLRHLSQCVPLVLERPDSWALAMHWFPQLADALQHMSWENKGRTPRCPVSESTRQVLKELSVVEQVVYDAVVRKIDFMLAALPHV